MVVVCGGRFVVVLCGVVCWGSLCLVSVRFCFGYGWWIGCWCGKFLIYMCLSWVWWLVLLKWRYCSVSGFCVLGYLRGLGCCWGWLVLVWVWSGLVGFVWIRVCCVGSWCRSELVIVCSSIGNIFRNYGVFWLGGLCLVLGFSRCWWLCRWLWFWGLFRCFWWIVVCICWWFFIGRRNVWWICLNGGVEKSGEVEKSGIGDIGEFGNISSLFCKMVWGGVFRWVFGFWVGVLEGLF